MDGDVHFAQRVDELDRGREVRLVRRDDVAARIAQLRARQLGPQLRVALGRCAATASAASATPAFSSTAATATATASRCRRAALDRALAHSIDVEQQVLAVARGVVDHAAVERHRVVDRLLEPPLLRRDRIRHGRGSAVCRCSTNGIRIGVGLPIVSVRIAMMLWKFPVFRMPPFHQPSYGPPDAIVAPGFPSAASRWCMCVPSACSPRISSGSRL